MDHVQKVMWSEGMFLTPHHFQQWDRHWEHVLQQRLKSVEALSWGLCELKINEDALTNGEFILAKATGLMADGLTFDIPDHDEAPKSRQIGPSFDPKTESLAVYLAAPLIKTGGVAVADASSGRLARYQQKLVTIADDNTGANDRQVAAAVKGLYVLFEGEPLEDYVSIKIAELGRSATGTFNLREKYVPPCLYVSASAYLVSLVRRVVEVISTKSADLSKQRRQRSAGLVEFTMSEAANFWYLHTVNAYIPTLVNYYHRPQVHPERVYMEMARLAGELYTFASEGHPKDIPLYVHDDVGATFTALEEKLRQLMETIIPTRCVPIPLEKTRESLFTGRVADEQMLEKAQFYLAVMASVPDEKIVKEIPLKAKISSLDKVNNLIAAALRGVSLKHLPTPPSEIPVQPGRNYFQVQKGGEHWDAVKGSRTLAFFVPPEFVGLKLELMAVKE